MRNYRKIFRSILITFFIFPFPILLAIYILHLWNWDFTIPLAYGTPGADEVWQLVSTKTLIETGWVLNNPYMGAPGISTWYGNSASQISIIHQLMMLMISQFVDNAIRIQQYYYVLNFSLITLTSYILARSVNIRPLLSLALGITYAFTSYRIGALFFAYLSNYFIIPLSLIPIYWVLLDKYSYKKTQKPEITNAANRKTIFYLLVGGAISIVTAASDGYYSFFYVLLLGFSVVYSFANFKDRTIRSLLAPIIFIFLTISTSLIITYPLYEHRSEYSHEADQDQMKSPSDAEVYSPTIKLLVMPHIDGRIDYISDLANKILDTANFNRKFPYKIGAPVVLGFLGSLLLFGSWILILKRPEKPGSTGETCPMEVAYVSSYAALFILLCSIIGGIGSLIALVYPTIRAYERFPIFLLLVLYLGGLSIIEHYIRQRSNNFRYSMYFLIAGLSTISILDHTRHDQLSLGIPAGFKSRTERFLAERKFIADVEHIVPSNSMIYQYPFSQYLSNNKYYGWGSFGQIRAYLHSKSIRWSNGAAKDSYVDKWHAHTATLPLEKLIARIQSIGFYGILVDRLVISDDEFQDLKVNLTKLTGNTPLLGDAARLAFWKLDKLPYRLTLSEKFDDVKKITIFEELSKEAIYSDPAIDWQEIFNILSDKEISYPYEIDRYSYPKAFHSLSAIEKGFGWEKISTDELKGAVLCPSINNKQNVAISSSTKLTVLNEGDFDWNLDSGQYPFRIGVIVTDMQGSLLRDIRIPNNQTLRAHDSLGINVQLYNLLKTKNDLQPLPDKVRVSIKMVQDGSAWFEGDSNRCNFTVNFNSL